MTRKKKPKFEVPAQSVKELDKALYSLLQLTFDLKLISRETFHHATTCETKLFGD